ncbi:beta-glucan synthesis-associated protein [Lecanora helva]
MASLSKATASPRDSTVPSDNEQLACQNGRSSTSLAAEAAAAALRNFARGRSPPSKRSSTNSSTSHHSVKSTNSKSRASSETSNVGPQLTIASSPSFPPSRSRRASAISLRRSDGAAINLGEDAITPISPRGSLKSKSATSPHEIRSLPKPSSGKLRETSQQCQRTPHPGTRPQTPLSYSELGKDYSRYPFPSRKNSISGYDTPTPPYTGTPGGNTPPLQALAKNPLAVDVTHLGYVVDSEKRSSWLLDDRIGAPGAADAGCKFPLYLDEKEIDDNLHMPQSDDDQRLKPKLRDFFALGQLCSLFGLLFMLVGLCCVFILLPVLSYSGTAIYSYPYHSDEPDGNITRPEPDDKVNDVKYPLFQNIRTGLIDPDTPQSALTRKSLLGQDLELVFSDEFNRPNRTFYQGDDPFWTAPDFWYGATQDLEWYDADVPTTVDGTLRIRMDAFQNHGLNYRSGMLNSWNQLCFKGGALEISVSLPGAGGTHGGGISGLWPGAWTMGNLGRPGYKASTDGIWPYTYNSCDLGITPNQSMTDGTSYLLGQKLPSCTCSGEDHPTPGTGRGAPEIDLFEASADPTLKLGVITQSYQVAPYDIWYHPNYEFLAFPNYDTSQLNAYCGGPYQQAISGQTELNNQWYDGNLYQKYGFEYTPGTGNSGQIAWFVGNDMSYMMNGDAIGPNGNVDSRPISEEPMSIVLNLGISPAWTGINFGELVFPTTMYVDYVRLYQPMHKTSVTCDPPGYETTDYIKKHPKAYNNINLTNWDATGYGWPKHRLNTNC